MSLPAVTIVVPAFNESRFIARSVRCLRECTASIAAQIIVVDNNSTDGTGDLARTAGADLVLERSGTVAALRNEGARHAVGDVLVFMDADVFPTDEWAHRISRVAQAAISNRIVTGSWVSVPTPCSWIERHWFKPLENGRNAHINSGHLIISKQLFWELGGFNALLITGEDFDLSVRAKQAGARIVDDPSLRVIHEGYPKAISTFLRREIWHGVGDCQDLSGFLSSRVAIVATIVLHAQVLAWTASIVTRQLVFGLAATGITLAICMGASIHRYGGVSLRTRVVTTLLYYCYFMARGFSLYARMTGAGSRAARRPGHT